MAARIRTDAEDCRWNARLLDPLTADTGATWEHPFDRLQNLLPFALDGYSMLPAKDLMASHMIPFALYAASRYGLLPVLPVSYVQAVSRLVAEESWSLYQCLDYTRTLFDGIAYYGTDPHDADREMLALYHDLLSSREADTYPYVDIHLAHTLYHESGWDAGSIRGALSLLHDTIPAEDIADTPYSKIHSVIASYTE